MVTVKGKKIEWRPGLTVRDVLIETGYNFPNIQAVLNKKVIKRKDWDTCLVPDESRVDILYIVSGG
jgi:thiamine biosynthesis protein ThiS